ncbi:hypothetical protein D3C75_575610 [compost metagenome]
MACFAFFGGNFALNDHLRRDAGVVSPRLPQSIFTLHALVTNHGVHDRLLEGVTHMQAAGNVRRRDHDAEAFLAGIAIWLKVALLFPMLVKRLFDILRVICLFHCLLCRSRRGMSRRSQVETSNAIGFVAIAGQLFLSVFVRYEVYHFMESGGKICELRQQANQHIAW